MGAGQSSTPVQPPTQAAQVEEKCEKCEKSEVAIPLPKFHPPVIGSSSSSKHYPSTCPMSWFQTTETAPTPPPAAPAAVQQAAEGCCPMKAKEEKQSLTANVAGSSSSAKQYPSTCPMSWFQTTEKAPALPPAAPAAVQAAEGGCPMKAKEAAAVSACPRKDSASSSYKNPNAYNVYSQKIDPTNNMPVQANQQQTANQTKALSTERQVSTIMKGGVDGNATWVYPSPQMFWNALARKDKLQGVQEEDMDTVIAIHNNMNENTWYQVLEWEKMHPKTGAGEEPKLLRFLGRPDDLSPKARLKMLFGHPAPFDRHDWVVDRGGTEVRYIIDYYHDESNVESDVIPKTMTDVKSMQSIKVDVRPALDGARQILDRVFAMPWLEFTGKTGLKTPSFFPPSKMVLAEAAKRRALLQNWATIQSKCEGSKDALINCKSDDECAKAAIALQKCSADVACPSHAADFDACISAKTHDGEKMEAAFTGMSKCLELFQADLRKAMAEKK